MADWTWSLSNDTDTRELTQATSRRVTFRRRAPADASFTLPGRHEEATSIQELVSDLTVRRNGSRLFVGRIGSVKDTIDPDNHKVTVNAGDYAALLKRRLVYDTDALGPHTMDVGTLAMQIVNYTQGRTNGNLGITAGFGIPAGVTTPATTLSAGKSIGETLDLLSAAGLMDWEIDGDLNLNIWPYSRQNASNEVLDYGGVVCELDRNFDTANYANAGRFTGDDVLSPQLAAVADIATRDEGRWETQVGNRDIHDTALLASFAAAELARRSEPTAGIEVTFAAGRWRGPDHVWPGDIVTVYAASGRLVVDESMIVEELSVTLGDNGTETVKAALGYGFDADKYRTAQQDNEARIRDLERV